MMKYIAKANLDAFFEAADAHLHLYIPTNDKNGKAEYTRWTKGAELSNQQGILLRLFMKVADSIDNSGFIAVQNINKV